MLLVVSQMLPIYAAATWFYVSAARAKVFAFRFDSSGQRAVQRRVLRQLFGFRQAGKEPSSFAAEPWSVKGPELRARSQMHLTRWPGNL